MNCIECYNCDGTGYIWSGLGSPADESEYDTCTRCDGYGYIDEEDEDDK